MADTLSLYKLIILKMLEQVEYPLTNSQITEFILDKEYTNYFTVQQAPMPEKTHWNFLGIRSLMRS